MGDALSRTTAPLSIAVLAGGPSAERAVSLRSGAAVAAALADRGHRVVTIDPAEVDLMTCDWTGIDVVFIALHGTFGEDGQVQFLLEELRLPYTGSGIHASRLAFSKSASKERFLQHHVPTPPYVLIHESDSADRILKQAHSLGFPLVLKPDRQGSSLGVSLIRSPDDLPRALTQCFHLDSFGVLESLISGSEWTVGFVDDEPLPLIHIESQRAFFDFEAKYEDNATQYHLEFDIPPAVAQLITQTAQNACRAIGTRGLARVDVMLDKFDRPWVLEVNTIPGMTDHSLVPKAAAFAGLSLGELCERVCRDALPAQRCQPDRPLRHAG